MFKNIGKKIKMLAQVICWIGIVLYVILGLIMIISGVSGYRVNEESIIVGIVMLILGPLFSWIGSFLLYGLGDLIDNTQAIRNKVAPEPIAQPYYPQQPTYQEPFQNPINYQNPQQ